MRPAALLLLIAGCVSVPVDEPAEGDGGPQAECSADAACGEGRRCNADGRCEDVPVSCASSAGCGEGKRCTVAPGFACDGAASCAAPTVCADAVGPPPELFECARDA